MADTHTVMPKKLAQALMEAGMKHFDLGGPVQVGNGQAQGPAIGGFVGQLLGGDSFQASGANVQAGTNSGQLNTGYDQAQQGIQSQQNLTNTLNPQATMAVQNQQTLAQQLLNQSNGVGPNPAQAALNASTGTNVANQAALMASQRGASVNPALVARNAAIQGANTQQQAVGQAATLDATQQLNAQNALANLSNNQISQTSAANTANNSNIQGEQQLLQNANTQYNNNAVGMQSNINNVNAQTSAANTKEGGILGQVANGIGGAVKGITSIFGAGGGEVSNSLSSAGPKIEPTSALPVDQPSAPKKEDAPDKAKPTKGNMAGGAGDSAGDGTLNASTGALVPGKPAHPGNDYRNDVVPAMLSKGEIVLPNSVTQAPNMEKAAIAFIEHLKSEKDKENDKGYAKVAKSKKSLKDRVEHLEKLCMGGRA